MIEPILDKKFLTGLIAYTCSYIPVELLAATGKRPYRLLHGSQEYIAKSQTYVRVDACPLIKANLTYIITNQEKFAAIVGSTGCDMARRLFDVINEFTNIPTLIIDNPRTDRFQIYSDEIDWLVKELNRAFSIDIDNEMLGSIISTWQDKRDLYHDCTARQRSNPSRVASTDLFTLASVYHQGQINEMSDLAENISYKPRVYMIGSAISYESYWLLELIEQYLRIVGDSVCGFSRFSEITVTEPNLAGLKRAYYDQHGCFNKKPNTKFYDGLGQRIAASAAQGIITFTLDYCDAYEFELSRIQKKFDMPMLRLRSDFSRQNLSQLKVRIEAFAELLGNK
ncbi:hypothetical protein A2Y85_06645 [candidate division WOR-3 bacterium RBG_13_43_14]|uniref:2-hydroxyglutaryl-CoA dehydratase n=1 Tax=candidate division WOR-3 bacterium RBG_13_43_14 TaxID=1802590 RepID=A0A1F4UI17_UNCW3|nr:MAG: hypothetical protein A2Y85_06645 [candidate division WOR-3 bacterium RBG_13_43_14]